MNPSEVLLNNFYLAFQKKDFATMQASYHPDAKFSDPVFQDLAAHEVQAMWEMLLTSSKDLAVSFKDVKADDSRGSARWEAHYTFTLTGKKVHNIIDAAFVLRDGKILSHRDSFDLWRWSRMAFGISGIVLGWSPFLRNKIRQKARKRLTEFMKKENLTSA